MASSPRDATAVDGYPVGLTGALARCMPALVVSLLISLFLTLLVLAVPIYMMQIYDRVLSSRSIPTLIWLTIIVLGALAIFGVLYLTRSVRSATTRRRWRPWRWRWSRWPIRCAPCACSPPRAARASRRRCSWAPGAPPGMA